MGKGGLFVKKSPFPHAPIPSKTGGGVVVYENNYKKSSSSERKWRESTDKGQKQP